jgi:CHAD domain-containing protein
LPFVTKKLLVRRIKRYGTRLKRKLEEFCTNPTPRNIHDIRTSIRRLLNSYSLLNKESERSQINKYIKLSKRLFKYNSDVRDIDIICHHLKLYKNTESYRLQQNLTTKRERKLKTTITLGLQLNNMNLSDINGDYLSTRKTQSKFAKEKSKLQDRILRDLPIVTLDPLKIEELHELRKNSKKLRYLLELLPKEDKSISKLINIQDKLGLIHDFDITIEFLERCKQKYHDTKYHK